jgi:hypothetical protein
MERGSTGEGFGQKRANKKKTHTHHCKKSVSEQLQADHIIRPLWTGQSAQEVTQLQIFKLK